MDMQSSNFQRCANSCTPFLIVISDTVKAVQGFCNQETVKMESFGALGLMFNYSVFKKKRTRSRLKDYSYLHNNYMCSVENDRHFEDSNVMKFFLGLNELEKCVILSSNSLTCRDSFQVGTIFNPCSF